MSAPKGLRILFADDEKSLQEFMRAELPRLGHEVTVCPDGKAAVKTLEKNTFDAAILDLRMPGLNGIEVLEQLKQVSPDTEAIVMTNNYELSAYSRDELYKDMNWLHENNQNIRSENKV